MALQYCSIFLHTGKHRVYQSMDQSGKVANPVRGQLNREYKYFPVPVRAWSFGLTRRVRPSCPASACSFFALRLNLVLTNEIPPNFRGGVHLFIPPYAIGSVPSLSGHATAYRWRSLPRVCRHRASNSPQGNSSNMCCLCRYHRGSIKVLRLYFATHAGGVYFTDTWHSMCLCHEQ